MTLHTKTNQRHTHTRQRLRCPALRPVNSARLRLRLTAECVATARWRLRLAAAARGLALPSTSTARDGGDGSDGGATTAISKKMSSIAPIAPAMQGGRFEVLRLCVMAASCVLAFVCERDAELSAVPPCTCHAAHSGRRTLARRCHGEAREAEVLRASGSTAHK